MWFRGFENTLRKFIVLVFSLRLYQGCEAITNADFNAQIRDYSVVGDHLNLTDVKTLQKQGLGLGRYANFAPVKSSITFKDVPDTVLSESNHARGLLHHEHTGYGFDYEDSHYGHGYDYKPHDGHHEPHDYHHYDFRDSGHHHSPGHHHGYGHHGHHKYYDHGLAHKTLLWPIAGIALLGAAAALVSNPVLLQLGVVSGKRRRRNVEEIENIAKNSIRKWSQTISDNKEEQINDYVLQKALKKTRLRKDQLKVVKRVLQSGKGDMDQFETVKNDPKRYSEEDPKYIPIPLIIKNQ